MGDMWRWAKKKVYKQKRVIRGSELYGVTLLGV
jgi:hypothetical protein